MTIGIERIERQRQPARAGLREAPRHVLGDAHAVGADDHPQSALRRAPDDLEDVAPQQRLAAGQDGQALGRERGDLVDDPEALLGAELAAIGEVLGADLRRAAGVEIAVLAGEVAAVGEVPGDDVGPGERAVPVRITVTSHMPKKSRAASRICLVHFAASLARGRTARCRSAPSGARTRGCSRAALRRRQSTGRRPARPGRRAASPPSPRSPGSSRANGQPGRRRRASRAASAPTRRPGRSARRATGRPASRTALVSIAIS